MRSSPREARELPDIDERLVMPDTPYEIVDGRLIRVSPADPQHGVRHSQIAALVEAHVAARFHVANPRRARSAADRALARTRGTCDRLDELWAIA